MTLEAVWIVTVWFTLYAIITSTASNSVALQRKGSTLSDTIKTHAPQRSLLLWSGRKTLQFNGSWNWPNWHVTSSPPLGGCIERQVTWSKSQSTQCNRLHGLALYFTFLPFYDLSSRLSQLLSTPCLLLGPFGINHVGNSCDQIFCAWFIPIHVFR